VSAEQRFITVRPSARVALKVSPSRALKDALAYPGNESFEQSLGRSVRRHGGTYQEYVELVSRVREAAKARKLSLREAARFLADQP
jgi:hypothetical protein